MLLLIGFALLATRRFCSKLISMLFVVDFILGQQNLSITFYDGLFKECLQVLGGDV